MRYSWFGAHAGQYRKAPHLFLRERLSVRPNGTFCPADSRNVVYHRKTNNRKCATCRSENWGNRTACTTAWEPAETCPTSARWHSWARMVQRDEFLSLWVVQPISPESLPHPLQRRGETRRERGVDGCACMS